MKTLLRTALSSIVLGTFLLLANALQAEHPITSLSALASGHEVPVDTRNLNYPPALTDVPPELSPQLAPIASKSSIFGYVFQAAGVEAIWTKRTPGLAVPITLRDSAMKLRKTTISRASDGYYKFSGLDQGNYIISATLPTGCQWIMPQNVYLPGNNPQQVSIVVSCLPPRDWDPRLGPNGLPGLQDVGVTDAQVQFGQTFWRLVKVVLEDQTQAGGDHTIYVTTLNKDGSRATGQTLAIHWLEAGVEQVQLLGPDQERGAQDPCHCNFEWPMYGAAYGAYIQGDLPSDDMYGMVLPNHEHVDYLLTYQEFHMP